MKDLCAMAETCKQMQRIVGNFSRKTYAGEQVSLFPNDKFYLGRIEVEIFVEYIQSIWVIDCSDLPFTHLNACKSLKQIQLMYQHRVKWKIFAMYCAK